MITAKRAIDLFWSVLGLLALAPLFAIVAVLIKLEDKGPVFFRQERVGCKGRPFFILKFRTMVRDAEKHSGELTVSRDPRITRVGSWLRKTKLDELPQLMNVLVGEMTMVGPRPEVQRYVDLYDDEQRKILDLIPGITDPASIKHFYEAEISDSLYNFEKIYINEIMPEKIRISLSYAEIASIWSDTRVVVSTILKIAGETFLNKRHKGHGLLK